MPELPEMETYRRHLCRTIVGHRIRSIIAERPKRLNQPAAQASLVLANSAIQSIERRGKSLAIWFEPTSGNFRVLYVHLMLGGRIDLSSTPQPSAVGLALDHNLHVNFHVGLGRLDFLDPGALQDRWSALGVEPLSPDYRPDTWRKALQLSTRPIKAGLMDQHIVAGIGNVYSDEILYRVGLHPGTPACRLTAANWEQLGDMVPRLLKDAVDAGGVGSALISGDQQSGGFREKLHVHYQAGRPCGNGGMVVKGRIAGRTAYWCPACQPSIPMT